MESGKKPVAIQGGYDFVDSRDVAEGLLLCEEKGKLGECYILNGHYITIKEILNIIRENAGKHKTDIELPYDFVKTIAPIAEKVSRLFSNSVPLFKPILFIRYIPMYSFHMRRHIGSLDTLPVISKRLFEHRYKFQLINRG